MRPNLQPFLCTAILVPALHSGVAASPRTRSASREERCNQPASTPGQFASPPSPAAISVSLPVLISLLLSSSPLQKLFPPLYDFRGGFPEGFQVSFYFLPIGVGYHFETGHPARLV